MPDEKYMWARADGCVGLTQAVRAPRTREARQVTEEDRPPPSTFPMIPAARAALSFTATSGLTTDMTARIRT